jgi:hypothetical protein
MQIVPGIKEPRSFVLGWTPVRLTTRRFCATAVG